MYEYKLQIIAGFDNYYLLYPNCVYRVIDRRISKILIRKNCFRSNLHTRACCIQRNEIHNCFSEVGNFVVLSNTF